MKYPTILMMLFVFLFACTDNPPSPPDNIINDMNFTQFSVDCGNITINMHIKSGYRYYGGESDSDYYKDRNWSLTQNFTLNDSNITKSYNKPIIEWYRSERNSNPVSSRSKSKIGKLEFSNDYSLLDSVRIRFSRSSYSSNKPSTSNGFSSESFVLINVPFTFEDEELVIDLNGNELAERLVEAIANDYYSSSNYIEGSSSYNRKESVGIVNIPDSAYVRIRCY